MMQVNSKVPSSNDPTLVVLADLIENRYHDLVRVANAELVTLFWFIGNDLNKNEHIFVVEKRTMDKDLDLRSISMFLSSTYGTFFTQKNLKRMSLFAELFSEFDAVRQFNYMVSWGHIVLLTKFKNEDERQFYLQYKIEYGLSVGQLKKTISSGLYQASLNSGPATNRKRISSKRKTTEKFKVTPQLIMQNDRGIQNIFKAPLSIPFRQLLNVKKKSSKKELADYETIPAIQKQFLKDLVQHIAKFRLQQNQWLNSNLNLLFWEIGRTINSQNDINKAGAESKSHRVASVLQKKYGKNFSRKQMNDMSKFAEHFPDFGEAAWVAYMISWPHIQVLLAIQRPGARLFYAKLTATEGLTPAELRTAIIKNTYKTSFVDNGSEQDKLDSIETATTKTTIRKKRNSTEVVTTVNYKFENLQAVFNVTNIYQNKYFLGFVDAF